MHRQEKDRENYEKMSEPFFAFLPEISRNGLRWEKGTLKPAPEWHYTIWQATGDPGYEHILLGEATTSYASLHSFNKYPTKHLLF